MNKRNKMAGIGTAGFLILCAVTGNVSMPAYADMAVYNREESYDTVSSGNTVSSGDVVLEMQPVSIQVPDNLDFVIDPWNLSGSGQIHSKQFTISNCGDAACILYLQDIICRPEGGVRIVEDDKAVYADENANVYLKAAFENGDILVLSPEKQEYTAILSPGDELTFRLTGAVNEKTCESWEDKKVFVALKYSCSSVMDSFLDS